MEKQIIQVEGMACGHCEVAVQDAVRKLSGIKKVKAQRRKKNAVVQFDSSEVSLEQIKAAINATGYKAI